MKKITLKTIRATFKDEGFTPKHNLHAIKAAINELNKEIDTDALKMLRLIILNEPIKALNTHSYGFHTSSGRHILDSFKNLYHKHNE
jgi:hypothetical protein